MKPNGESQLWSLLSCPCKIERSVNQIESITLNTNLNQISMRSIQIKYHIELHYITHGITSVLNHSIELAYTF